MLDLGTAVGYLMLNTSGFTSGFNDANRSLSVFTSSTATMSQKLSSLGSAMTSVGTRLATNVRKTI